MNVAGMSYDMSATFPAPATNNRAPPTAGTSQFISRQESSLGTGSKGGRGQGIAFPFINLDERERDTLAPTPLRRRLSSAL
jgi:hypothetical protein